MKTLRTWHIALQFHSSILNRRIYSLTRYRSIANSIRDFLYAYFKKSNFIHGSKCSHSLNCNLFAIFIYLFFCVYNPHKLFVHKTEITIKRSLNEWHTLEVKFNYKTINRSARAWLLRDIETVIMLGYFCQLC